MSNSIIPNFLPPIYDFTTEEDEDDTEEEYEEYDDTEEYDKGSLAFFFLYGAALGLVFCGLMGSEINASLKFSVSKSENKS